MKHKFTTLELHLLRALMVTICMAKDSKHALALPEFFKEVVQFSQDMNEAVMNDYGGSNWFNFVDDTIKACTLRLLPSGRIMPLYAFDFKGYNETVH